MGISQECSLAERKRKLVRDALSAAAAALLRERGYDHLTVEEIAEQAGVSRRTFFRYFSSREDVFVSYMEEFGQEIQDRLNARPAGEDPAAALRQAFTFTIDLSADGDGAFDLAKTTLGVPALRARYLEHLALLRTELSAELGRRHGLDDEADPRPTLAAAIAVATFDAALSRWVDSGRPGDLIATIDACFNLIADSINTVMGAPTPPPRRRRPRRTAANT